MRSRPFTLTAYSVALLTLLAGALLGLKLEEWSWFSRSGSLVVINGIILTSHQIIEHIYYLGRAQRREMQVNRDWASHERHHFLQGDTERLWRSEKCGLYMLIVGTLVWGFGDLINYL